MKKVFDGILFICSSPGLNLEKSFWAFFLFASWQYVQLMKKEKDFARGGGMHKEDIQPRPGPGPWPCLGPGLALALPVFF